MVVVVAFFVLFSALLDTRVSAGLALFFLIALAVYKLVILRHRRDYDTQ